MQKLIDLIVKLLSCHVIILGGIVLVSLFSLAAALIAEVVFGLEPCILCVYQRGPFALAIVLGLIGLIYRKSARPMIMLSGLGFLANSAIAFYHSGVELKWWRSAVEGCAVPNFGDNEQTMLENILSAPPARCDEIPWADPLLGLSMANYNVILCFGLFMACMLSFAVLGRKTS